MSTTTTTPPTVPPSPAKRNIFGLAYTNSVKHTSPPITRQSVDSVKGYYSPTSTEFTAGAHSQESEMSSIKRNMQHIDRKSLYTDLEARMRYIHSFLDFNSEDQAALILGSKYIKALIPAVVNIVYKKLLSYDITARAFTTRSTSYEGPMDDFPDVDSPQIKYRKMFLRGYLHKLCSDPTKMEFWEYLDKVGMMHVGQGRKHPLHVEYIHISVLLGFIQDVVFEAVLSHPRLKMDQKTAVIKALGKVLWIQNDLFAKWYVRDGDEFQGDKPEVQIEAEGTLHGKKIIDKAVAEKVGVDEGEEVEGKEEEGGERGCPFRMMGKIDIEDECCGSSSGSNGAATCPGNGNTGLPRPVVRIRVEEGVQN